MDMQNLLDGLLNRGLAEGCYPGAVAACGDRQTIFAVSCVGRTSEHGAPADRRTRYDMASLTKLLSPTMIALKALENGEISLYDAIGRFLPDVPADKRGINIRHLMTHTAGFAPSFLLEEAVKSPADALAAILNLPLDTAIGGEPHYSCMGYIVLGKALEAVYGNPLDLLAKKTVFEPLGMDMTGYLPKGGNIASTETDPKTGKALCGVVHDENARFLGGVSANAGVFSCIDDMLTFAQMLARLGDGFLTDATVKTAIRPHAVSPDMRRGLGFQLGGTPECFMGELFPPESFGHTGFTGTSLIVDPETGFFVVLLTNRVHPTRDNTRLMRFRRVFHNALYAKQSEITDKRHHLYKF